MVLRISLMEKIYKDNIFSLNQHGFVQGRTAESNLLLTYNYVTSKTDQRNPCEIVFLDFEKAFDKVDHFLLLKKLVKYKFDAKFVNYICNYLDARTQCVRVRGTLSSPASISSGVPQGAVLSPTLFLLYINDLLMSDFSNIVVAFTDDLKVLGLSTVHQDMQSDLAKINNWCDRNSMIINVKKCGVMYFGFNNPRID